MSDDGRGKKRRISVAKASGSRPDATFAENPTPMSGSSGSSGKKDSNPTSEYFSTMARLHRIGVTDSGIDLRSSTIENAGLGLFATKEFAAGDPITAYFGAVISYEEARSKGRCSSHVRSLFPMRFVIDGRLMPDRVTEITNPVLQLTGEGAAAFANDARDEARNNAEFIRLDSPENEEKIRRYCFCGGQWTADPTESSVVLLAKRPIETGQEIFVGYGDDYWAKHDAAVDAFAN